jgi:hypothetical protein
MSIPFGFGPSSKAKNFAHCQALGKVNDLSFLVVELWAAGDWEDPSDTREGSWPIPDSEKLYLTERHVSKDIYDRFKAASGLASYIHPLRYLVSAGFLLIDVY